MLDGCDAGTALVAAMFLPNVEFIFGLAGSTASVLIAYILPAAIFLIASSSPKAPAGTLVSIQSPSHQHGIAAHAAHGQHLSSESQPLKEGAPPQLSPRGLKGPRRKAWGLLVFGVLVAVVCTHATLTAVQEEAEVVQLAQELAASEAAVSVPTSWHHPTAHWGAVLIDPCFNSAALLLPCLPSAFACGHPSSQYCLPIAWSCISTQDP